MSRNYGLSLYDWDSDGMADNPRWGTWAKYEDVEDLLEERDNVIDDLNSEIASLQSQLEEALSQIDQQMDGD